MLVKEFFDFIYERQLIWYKRFILKENSPWTKDITLQKYKIINVYRELDKCTLYIIEKLKDIKDREKLLLNVVFYRFFNQYNLYKNLGVEPFEKIEKERLLKSFKKIQDSGKPIFNNAYLIAPGTPNQPKYVSILEFLEKINLKEIIRKIDNSKTPRESLKAIQEIRMVGPFLACEIWTDLSYFNFFKQKWNDNNFVNIGPGAEWGLDILFGRKLDEKEREEKLNYLHQVQKDFLDNEKWRKIAYKEAFSNYPFLSITNIEGSLCEFRKYWRIKSGKGRRKYFVPSTGKSAQRTLD